MTPRREPGAEVASKPAASTAAADQEKAVPKEEEKPKEETTGKVELKKETGGFGLSLVGGADTPLVIFWRKHFLVVKDVEKSLKSKSLTRSHKKQVLLLEI